MSDAVERAARASWDANKDHPYTWDEMCRAAASLPGDWHARAVAAHRAHTRAALAAAAPTVEDVVDAIHGHPVEVAPYLGVWECTCGAPIRGMREQAERVVALWGAR